MKTLVILLGVLLLVWGCTTKETKDYITNNTGPADWQPPVLRIRCTNIWRTSTPPSAPVTAPPLPLTSPRSPVSPR